MVDFIFLNGQIALSFKKYKYYIITAQPYNISSWILLFINKLIGKKTYVWNHGWYGNETMFQKRLRKFQFQFITGYFLYGNYAKNLMVKEGFNEKKLHVIYNSLNYAQSLKIRSKLN